MSILLLYIFALLKASQQAMVIGVTAMVLLGGLLYLLIRYMLRQQVKTKKQEVRIRNRIAANLHDDLGSLLLRMQLQTEALLVSSCADEVSLERLLDTTRSACSALRDVAWGLDAEADTLHALQDRMRDLLDHLALVTPLHVRFVVEGLDDVVRLPPRLRQELYLVFKEATTNAVRHAQNPTCLAVRLYREKDTLVLKVQDDGSAISQPAQPGMGMRNMKRRAHAVKGTLDAAPQAGNAGFQVTFCAPLPALSGRWSLRG